MRMESGPADSVSMRPVRRRSGRARRAVSDGRSDASGAVPVRTAETRVGSGFVLPTMKERSSNTGDRGEAAAAEWLRAHGFEICARNWRSGRYEIDIVARRQDVLHFVEVKTRRAGGLTPPEAAITIRKFRALRCAAEAYLERHPVCGELQFDLAAVDVADDGAAEVRFVERAMECHW